MVVQLAPLMTTLVAWGYIEVQRRRLAFTRRARRQSDFVACVALLVIALLLWRVFDLMQCVEEGNDLNVWRTPVVLGGFAIGGLVFTNGYRFPRIAIFLGLLFAGTAAAADWALRGGLDLLQESNETVVVLNVTQRVTYPQATAAVPLVAVQQLWCLFTIAMFARLPSRMARAPKTVREGSSGCKCIPCCLPMRAVTAPTTNNGKGITTKDPESGRIIATFAVPDALDRRQKEQEELPPRSWFA